MTIQEFCKKLNKEIWDGEYKYSEGEWTRPTYSVRLYKDGLGICKSYHYNNRAIPTNERVIVETE